MAALDVDGTFHHNNNIELVFYLNKVALTFIIDNLRCQKKRLYYTTD